MLGVMADPICAESGFKINMGSCNGRRRQNLVAFALLAILLALIYGNSFDCDWHFDDHLILVGNKNLHLKSLAVKDLIKTFYGPRVQGDTHGKSRERLSRPIVSLTLALNYYFGQEDVLGYHIVNLLIHYISAVFLFLFIQTTLKLPKLEKRYGKVAYGAALLTAAMWAVSPVHVSAVTYIVQRMASMAAMGYIMAMYFYVKARTSDSLATQWAFFSAGAICWLVALGSKENAAMLPLILVLYDLLLIREISRKNMLKTLKQLALPVTVVLIIGFAWIWQHYSGAQAMFKDYQHFSFTLTERMLTAPRILLYYISVLLYPIQSRVALVCDIETSRSMLELTRTAIPFLMLAGFMVLTIILIVRRRYLVAFCILFFFINHIPEGTIVPLHLAFLHRNYLPSMLFFLPLVLFFIGALEYFAYNRRLQYGLVIGLGFILACHGSTTFSLNRIWKTEQSLWQDNIEKSSGLSLPYNNLGNALFKSGRYDAALIHFQKALYFNRQEVLKLRSLFKLNVARAYLVKNVKTDKAIDLSRQVIEEKAIIKDACHVMALALLRKRRYREALTYSRKAVWLSPDDFDANLRYALALLKNEQLEEVFDVARKTMRLKPIDGRSFAILGEAFRRKKNVKRSIFFWKLFQNKYPLNPEGVLALIGLYDGSGLRKKAADQVRRLLLLSGDSGPMAFVERYNADAGAQVYVPDPDKLVGVIRNLAVNMLGPSSEG